MTEHYFTESPGGQAEQRSLRVRLAGREVTVRTAGGVFSPDRVDLGTAVLLREVPDPPRTGDLLDLGCGWGPLTFTLGLLAPEATVWGVDVNRRALDLARDNARALGLAGVRVCPPEEVPTEVRFDLIWSNPPIRVGKDALHALLATWLPRLAPGGTAYLVVQRNLGGDSLQAWLAGELGKRCTVGRLASAKGYRVLSVRASRRP